MKEIDYKAMFAYNSAIERSARMPKKRLLFYIGFKDTNSLESIVNRLTKKSILKTGLIKIKKIFECCLH